jgi:hypothetical protein
MILNTLNKPSIIMGYSPQYEGPNKSTAHFWLTLLSLFLGACFSVKGYPGKKTESRVKSTVLMFPLKSTP